MALEMQKALSNKLRKAVAGRESDPSIELMFDWIDPLDRASAVLLLAITQGLADHFLESADNLEANYSRIYGAALICGNISFTASINDFRVLAFCLEDCMPPASPWRNFEPAKSLAEKLKAAVKGHLDYEQAKLIFDICDQPGIDGIKLLTVANRVIAGRMAITADTLGKKLPSRQISA
jgi:hypothetical protein